MKLLAIISFFIVLSSCSDLNKSKQISRVDTMMDQLNSSSVLLNENEIENATDRLSLSTDLVDEIKNFEDDTINLEIAFKFDRYKKMHDDLVPAMNHYEELVNSVKVEKAILQNLKKDISHQDGKRSKYDEYLSFEEKKVTELESAITLYTERKNDIKTTYDELHNEISQLLVERFTASEVQ